MAAKKRVAGKATGKGAIKATAVTLALNALQNEEVQRRLKAAGAQGLDKLRTWNQEHGPTAKLAEGASVTEVAQSATRLASRQGRLEARVDRLAEAEQALRASGQSGARVDWLTQTLTEADTSLVIARSLPRDKRRHAHDSISEMLAGIEEVLFASVHRPNDLDPGR
jgi:hypothetical protein